MLISTMNDVPGYKVTAVLGEVFGLTVRSRNMGSQFGAAFKSLAGGELKGMTKNLQLSRQEVIDRMVGEAEARGGQRRARHALRHLRDGRQLDRDLRLRHRGRHRAARVSTAAGPAPDLVARLPARAGGRAPRCGSCARRAASLPEYRAGPRYRDPSSSPSRDAALSAELTLQPVRRYGVDAAILFSDIVVPLHAIGFGVDVEPGRGPVVAQPFRSAADLPRLRAFEPEADAPYVAETVRLVRAELEGSGVRAHRLRRCALHRGQLR